MKKLILPIVSVGVLGLLSGCDTPIIESNSTDIKSNDSIVVDTNMTIKSSDLEGIWILVSETNKSSKLNKTISFQTSIDSILDEGGGYTNTFNVIKLINDSLFGIFPSSQSYAEPFTTSRYGLYSKKLSNDTLTFWVNSNLGTHKAVYKKYNGAISDIQWPSKWRTSPTKILGLWYVSSEIYYYWDYEYGQLQENKDSTTFTTADEADNVINILSTKYYDINYYDRFHTFPVKSSLSLPNLTWISDNSFSIERMSSEYYGTTDQDFQYEKKVYTKIPSGILPSWCPN